MGKGDFITNAKKLEFREIVLSHIKKILEISSSELGDRTYEEVHANYSTTVHKEDTRKAYIQSIENLGYILLPYFDKHAQEVYEECIYVIVAFGFDLKKYFKKEIERIIELKEIERIPSDFFIEMKIRYAKKLFCELNLLLKRVDYLKGIVYGEASEDNEIVDTDKKIE